MTDTLPITEAEKLSAELSALKAGERLSRLYERYGSRLAASTSFGLQSAVMLKLIADHAPQIPVVFIDTGYHFPETYRYADELVRRFGTDLRVYQSTHSAARIEALWGPLWEQGREGMDRYAMLTKIEPMDRALRELGADVWLSGVRRSQSSTRVDRPFAEQQKKTLKVYPILDWADAQISVYMHEQGLPSHPLAEKGYVTMGDWHSTRPAVDGMSAEATRFNGEKYECGLHLDSGNTDFQI
ncbi:MAG: phosphoadenylyl-sulfate reductase [Verrucomicrobia bacterium]|nr:MAG: phosphoadenylyl-sulfate reductase [Verrucomicrobiota bacterium]TAE86613.1 MAG: phosphoadenylyl-sulfate reductase [Verrucomicrobiota bacterium]TAF24306.1 MAG: phosphoadenylyl-sulfate reductase [Verrucomicrobiota bacterium]TAF40360.1 MAG: phosphoadenylyl-sulfate reductase [Verrucomicrobiota bacterium]